MKAHLLRIIKSGIVLCLIISAFMAGAFLAAPVHTYADNTPDFSLWKDITPLTSHVYDRHGNEIATLHGEQNRIFIPLEEIPLHVQQAFIAIEDERFYYHIGIDPIAIVRSFISNLRSGRWTEQGGSTITQQLIKNTYLTSEKTLERKLKEAWFSILLERKYTKDEILEMYLNTIYFAHGTYGLEAAANLYFNKSAGELSVSEGALLAGIPRLPNHYSPYINWEGARQRQQMVLHKMYELQYIDGNELENYKGKELALNERASRDYPHPYFLDYMLHRELVSVLEDLHHFNCRSEAYDAIYTGGLKIYTTLDPALQETAESLINDEDNYAQSIRVDMQMLSDLSESGEDDRLEEALLEEGGIPQPQASMVIADPSSGELLALIGGREYNQNNQTLRYLSPRQPGSAIKPLLVYAPAIEENLLLPGSIVDDAPFIRGDWAPENFRRRFLGLVTVRQAVSESLNVPAVKIFADLGPEKGVEYATKIGLSTLGPDDYHLAAALGGVTNGVTPLEIAQSYAVLANEGVKSELHTIRRVENSMGHVIYENNQHREVILSTTTAFLVTDMLKDVARTGTAAALRTEHPLAVKTGTSSHNRDAYLIAYTPELVISFWMGHDLRATGNIQGGSSAAIPFFNALFDEITENMTPPDFTKPQGIAEPVKICSKSGKLPGPYCPSEKIVSEFFPETLVPQDECDRHIVINVCRTSHLLPGLFCPSAEVEPWVFLDRPPYKVTDERWRGEEGRKPADAYRMPPTEYCNMHNWWNYRPWR